MSYDSLLKNSHIPLL